MPSYNPPTRVRTLNIPWKAMVTRADPAFEAEKRREVEYEFSNGRKFTANPAVRGAYAED